jgi:hypothetical protein
VVCTSYSCSPRSRGVREVFDADEALEEVFAPRSEKRPPGKIKTILTEDEAVRRRCWTGAIEGNKSEKMSRKSNFFWQRLWRFLEEERKLGSDVVVQTDIARPSAVFSETVGDVASSSLGSLGERENMSVTLRAKVAILGARRPSVYCSFDAPASSRCCSAERDPRLRSLSSLT